MVGAMLEERQRGIGKDSMQRKLFRGLGKETRSGRSKIVAVCVGFILSTGGEGAAIWPGQGNRAVCPERGWDKMPTLRRLS